MPRSTAHALLLCTALTIASGLSLQASEEDAFEIPIPEPEESEEYPHFEPQYPHGEFAPEYGPEEDI